MKSFAKFLVILVILGLAVAASKPKVKAKTCMVTCGKKLLGYFQSCESCGAYVTCVFGAKYDRKCPGTLKWDDKKKECLYRTSTCEDIKG